MAELTRRGFLKLAGAGAAVAAIAPMTLLELVALPVAVAEQTGIYGIPYWDECPNPGYLGGISRDGQGIHATITHVDVKRKTIYLSPAKRVRRRET